MTAFSAGCSCLLLSLCVWTTAAQEYTSIADCCPENCYCPRKAEIRCKGVPIKELPEAMCRELEHLTIIDAEMRVLTPEMFAGYPRLTRLHLQNAGVERVMADAFAGLPHLRILTLIDNQIERLEPFSFRGLHRLRLLRLNNNQIQSLGRDAFHGVTGVGNLDLRLNPVSKLERGTFDGLRGVKRLMLPLDLSLIEPGSFENLSDVHYLEIRGWKPSSADGVQPGTFRGLRRVQTLQIEKSELSVLRPDCFSGMDSIDYLYIRNSVLGRVRRHMLRGASRIYRFGLVKNQIGHLDYNAVVGELPDANVQQLDMTKNHFNCSCPDSIWMLRSTHIFYNHSDVLRKNFCATPIELANVNMLNATELAPVNCNYGNDTDLDPGYSSSGYTLDDSSVGVTKPGVLCLAIVILCSTMRHLY